MDTLILMIPLIVLGFLMGGDSSGAGGAGFALEGAAAMLYMAIGFALWLGYYTYLEGTSGATIGKRILGLQVVRLDGGKIDMRQALIRNLLRIVDGFFTYLVGAVLIWTSPTRQRLGDRIAGTTVVRRSSVTAPEIAKT